MALSAMELINLVEQRHSSLIIPYYIISFITYSHFNSYFQEYNPKKLIMMKTLGTIMVQRFYLCEKYLHHSSDQMKGQLSLLPKLNINTNCEVAVTKQHAIHNTGELGLCLTCEGPKFGRKRGKS
jgi:hypothetical protein